MPNFLSSGSSLASRLYLGNRGFAVPSHFGRLSYLHSGVLGPAKPLRATIDRMAEGGKAVTLNSDMQLSHAWQHGVDE